MIALETEGGGSIQMSVGGTMFTGSAVYFYQARMMAISLRLYGKTGMKPSRRWVPKEIMERARRITGRKFPLRAYDVAADALEAWARSQILTPESKQAIDEHLA